MLNNNYIFSLNIWASRISLFWFESSHWFVDSQKNAKYHKTCASSIWHSRGKTYKPVQARLHLFEMFIWHRKRSIKEPSPVSVALMGFQQTCPENKTSPVLTSCFSNDQRRMSSQRFDPGWGNCKRTPPKPQCPATSQGRRLKLKPPDHRLIQVCLILTRLTKGIRRECEMKDVFGCILRQACDQREDTDRGMTRINSLKVLKCPD